jgi:hypothetical protein
MSFAKQPVSSLLTSGQSGQTLKYADLMLFFSKINTDNLVEIKLVLFDNATEASSL